ncbi:MAG TPA: hypothetical protein VI636_01015 [Candidatus Angelobacter sp.]
MRTKARLILAIQTFVAGLALVSCLAKAQDTPSAPLADQLKAQYTLAKTTGYQDTFQVVQSGTVLVIQKDGIWGSPPSDMTLLVNKYQDGQLHPPGQFSLGMKKVKRRFSVGEKVYAARIDVNAGKDSISIWLLECGSCNGTNDADSYKADLVFQFGKGTLQKMGVPDVMDTIGQVLAFDQPAQTAQDQQPQAQQDQTQDPPAQTQNIHAGQTVDEVVNALGPPQKKVDLGSKQIFIYKDLKVTFKDGKVADAE